MENGRIPDVVSSIRPQNGSVANPAYVYEAKTLPVIPDADTVYIMGNEFIDYEGRQLWAFIARSAGGFSNSVKEINPKRNRHYDDRITVFMWKNGDHTQVFSILDVESPDISWMKGMIKKKTIKGLSKFKIAADNWEKEKKNIEQPSLVHHWN